MQAAKTAKVIAARVQAVAVRAQAVVVARSRTVQVIQIRQIAAKVHT